MGWYARIFRYRIPLDLAGLRRVGVVFEPVGFELGYPHSLSLKPLMLYDRVE